MTNYEWLQQDINNTAIVIGNIIASPRTACGIFCGKDGGVCGWRNGKACDGDCVPKALEWLQKEKEPQSVVKALGGRQKHLQR